MHCESCCCVGLGGGCCHVLGLVGSRALRFADVGNENEGMEVLLKVNLLRVDYWQLVMLRRERLAEDVTMFSNRRVLD